MSELDLLHTELEEDLRASVRELLTDRCPPAAVIATYDGDRTLGPDLWRALSVQLGLSGLLVPDERGGVGGSAREAAVVQEELGRFVAPVPFLTSAVIATTVLLHADRDAAAPTLSALATGARTASLAVPWATAPHAVAPAVHEVGGRLSGTITSVAGALEADLLLVPVVATDGLTVYAVDIGQVVITPVISLDMTRQLADITLVQAPGSLVCRGGEPAIRRGLQAGAALLASEQLGIARWCLQTTVEYVKGRRQFGRAVGGFQAVKHRLADLYTEVESAAAAARYAAAALAQDDHDLAVAVAIAQAYCSETAVRAAEEAVQLHGGIGMTWEHPAHLYLKRAKSDQIALGTPGAHRARLGELVDLGP